MCIELNINKNVIMFVLAVGKKKIIVLENGKEGVFSLVQLRLSSKSEQFLLFCQVRDNTDAWMGNIHPVILESKWSMSTGTYASSSFH